MARAARRSECGQRVENRGGFGADRVEATSTFGDDARDFGGGACVVVFEAAIELLPWNSGQRSSRLGVRAERSTRHQHRYRRIPQVALPVRGVVVGAYLAPS